MISRRSTILLLLAASAALLIRYGVPDSASHDSEAPGGEDRHMRASVYDDEGAWNESVVALTRLLTWMNYTVETVDSAAINSGALDGFSLLCVPGGDMYQYSQSISAAGKRSIRSFIEGGGGYLGVCGGAYFSLDAVVWRGRALPMEPLRLVPGTAVGPMDELAPYPEYAVTEVAYTGHGRSFFEGLGESAWMLYYWGPALEVEESLSVSVLGVYAENGLPAVVIAEKGSGRVALVGTHPEIEENDARDGSAWGQELDDRGSDWPILERLVAWVDG